MQRVSVLLVAFGAASVSPSGTRAEDRVPAGQLPATGQARGLEAFGRLPLRFEKNVGQTDPRVGFLSRGHGYQLFLTPSEVVLSLQETTEAARPAPSDRRAGKRAGMPGRSVLRMKFVGGKAKPEMMGADELPGRSNYFIGNDPKLWRTDVVQYGRVVYHDLWKGIDLAFYGTGQGQLESDFRVSPGADPSVIRMAFDGVRRMRLDQEGNLVIETGAGKVIQHRPLVYQEVAGVRKLLDGSWVAKGRNRVGFQVASYDRSQALVIDPVLVYSTYLGGSAFDGGHGIATDAEGHAYVTGETYSVDFPMRGSPFQPVKGGAFLPDVFVAKLDVNPGGAGLLYSTYLGGNDDDIGYGIAVDGTGNTYMTGVTCSADFPTAGDPFQAALAGYCDAFVTKLSPTFRLLYSTYLGGNDAYAAWDAGHGIATDAAGEVYVTGVAGPHFPLAGNPLQPAFGGGDVDAFVAKLRPASGLLYSAYLGGNAGDAGYGVAVDGAGNAYVTGWTRSTNFPRAGTPASSLGGEADAFVAKVSPTSGLVYSTYLGGSGDDGGAGIAVDAAGNAYVAGSTKSANFPTAGNPFQGALAGKRDAFITKLNPTSSLLYSTYLGGSEEDRAGSVAVDGAGNAYVIGDTNSADFPTAGDPFQAALADNWDAFITKLSPTAGLLYSTYLGGSGWEWGDAIAVDVVGNILVTGVTTADFPTAGIPFQAGPAGSDDAFVAKFRADSAPPPQAGPADFYTVTPCRLIDTRNADALLGGPALYANTNRNFVILGRCGIPPTAKAVSLNITATAQTAQGHLRLYPGGTTPPTASSLNYVAGQTRANNAIVTLGPLGDFGVRCVQGSGTAHLIVDVTGYFQ